MSPATEAKRPKATLIDPGAGALFDVTVFISCYNEEKYIIDTIETVREALGEVRVTYELIIIDDTSRDGSAALVEDYIARHPDCPIILKKNLKNRGLAQNYVDAAFLGCGKYYRLICGDNAEPKSTMVSIFSHLGEAEMLIPYYTSSEGKSLFRRSLSRVYSMIVNSITGFRLHYYNGLAVHHRYNVMRWHTNTRGFGFQADIVCLLLDEGFTYKEVAVKTIERKKGDSRALTAKNFLSVTHTLVDIAIRRLSNLVYRPGS